MLQDMPIPRYIGAAVHLMTVSSIFRDVVTRAAVAAYDAGAAWRENENAARAAAAAAAGRL